MLEADVLLRGQGTDEQQAVPILAHPPAVDSDLSLQEFLHWVHPSGKGIKLDFKYIQVVETSLLILARHKHEVRTLCCFISQCL